MRVPDGCQSLLVRVTARNNEFSDGEERTIPVLSRQIEVTRAVPFTLRRGESLQTKEAEARRKLMAQIEKGVKATFTTDTCRDARTEVAKSGARMDARRRRFSLRPSGDLLRHPTRI